MNRDEARMKWEIWEKYYKACGLLRKQKSEIEREIKLKQSVIRQIEKRWDACDEHEYEEKHCTKCGFPEF